MPSIFCYHTFGILDIVHHCDPRGVLRFATQVRCSGRSDMNCAVTPLTNHQTGAEIRGVDLARAIPDEAREESKDSFRQQGSCLSC